MAEEASSAINSISIKEEELRALIGLLERKIHRLIEQEQLIILYTEILRDKFHKDPQKITLEEADEIFEAISSAVMDNADLLPGIRNRIRSLATY
jgi:hypothetical protein